MRLFHLVAFLVILHSFWAVCGGVRAGEIQAGKSGKTKADDAPEFELLGFRECMPVMQRKTPATKRRKHGKIVIGPDSDASNRYKELKGAALLHQLVEDYYHEYALFVQKSLSLSKKIKSDSKNEALLREVNAQLVVLQNISDKWIANAIGTSKKIINEYPDYVHIDQVNSLMGEALWWSGKEKEALKVLRGLIKNHPNSKEMPRAYMFFGEYYLRKGDLDKAREAFGKAASEKRHDCAPCAAYRIAYCYHLSGNHQKAVELCKQCVKYGSEKLTKGCEDIIKLYIGGD